MTKSYRSTCSSRFFQKCVKFHSHISIIEFLSREHIASSYNLRDDSSLMCFIFICLRDFKVFFHILLLCYELYWKIGRMYLTFTTDFEIPIWVESHGRSCEIFVRDMVWNIMNPKFCADISDRMLCADHETFEFLESISCSCINILSRLFEMAWFLIMPMDELGWGWAGYYRLHSFFGKCLKWRNHHVTIISFAQVFTHIFFTIFLQILLSCVRWICSCFSLTSRVASEREKYGQKELSHFRETWVEPF